MSPRKASQPDLTKETIIHVARDLFVTEGYSSLSMRKMAKVLNCSHGSIYYHFKNKAELFYEMIEADFRLLDEELTAAISDIGVTNEEKLFQILYRFIQFGLTHPNHYEVMFLLTDEDVRNYIIEQPNKSYQQFAEAVASLHETPLTTKEIWSVFLSLHGFVTTYIRNQSTFEDVKMLATSHIQFLLKAIR
ncbi:TetR/AcrR family transcriptional regulator [Cytobacillus spongiae]|uniref:TetR/AcrR family transcriptional regulator n=1 Tax=Cytobacillus spongiae TaxID=2901381 RepID=UPI001F1C4FD8|nr:TetR/AcrR family transcriptional regulator [Cytobacillus spongiae]UII56488.1 TetR/AcrR family transcriptional regulator [Cytobacillus spongiae]